MRAAVVAFVVVTVAAGVAAGRGVTETMKQPPSLAEQARTLAMHGGIRDNCYGCATPRMKALVRALIRQTFRPAGWTATTRALCFSRRESGWNPGAVSPTDDHSSFQVNRPTHPQFDYWRMDHDPAYGVWAGWVVSSRGTDWGPWSGGVYAC